MGVHRISTKSKKKLVQEIKEGIKGEIHGGSGTQLIDMIRKDPQASTSNIERDLRDGRVEQMYKLEMEDIHGPFTTWEHGKNPKDAVKNARERRSAPDWVWNVMPCLHSTWGLQIEYAPTDPTERQAWNVKHLARANPHQPERAWTPLSLSSEDKENLEKIGNLFESDKRTTKKILGSPNQQLPMSEIQKLESLLLELGAGKTLDGIRRTIKKVCTNQHLMHIRNLRQSWHDNSGSSTKNFFPK